MNKSAPFLIEFPSIGDSTLGYLSVGEELSIIPFPIARVYWTYYTPQNVTRGGHANIQKELVLIAVAGAITITTELQNGNKSKFVLDHPAKGLYIPKLCWHSMHYSHSAVQMVIASNRYSEYDYIREHKMFKQYGKL